MQNSPEARLANPFQNLLAGFQNRPFLASFLSYYWENCRNIGHDIRKFEKKLMMHLQMLCGGLPANKF
jgi:hypothetical protein